MSRWRCRRRSGRLLAGAAACCLAAALPAAARGQTVDLGGGGDTGMAAPGGGSTGAGGSTGMGGGSLLPNLPPQPDGIETGPANLPMQGGQTLRDRLGSALGVPAAPSPAPPAVQVNPAIGLQQGWTNNALAVPGAPAESAFFTSVNPSVSVTADTQRLTLSATYTPDLIVYEPPRGQNVLAQNLSAQGHAILLPDTLFVDLSAFAGQQTITGGLGPASTVQPNQTNAAQDYSVSLSPYLMHRFGGTGTAEIGGSVSQMAQIVPGGVVAAALPGLPAVAVNSQNVTSTQEFINFTSGEDFGRLLSTVSGSAEQFWGTGVFGGGSQNGVSYQAAYAVTHTFDLLGTIGWQDLHYGGIPPVNISGLLWNVGFQFTPDPVSSITVRYGRSDGINAAFVSGSYDPTARTRVTANYSVTVSTDQQQLQSALTNATTDAAGNLVSAQTGTPLLQNNNFLGLNQSVYRLTSGALTAALLLDRDTFQVGVDYQAEAPLNVAAAGQINAAVTGTYGTLTWLHDLSPAVQTSLYVQYGVSQWAYGGSAQQSTVLVGSGQISYAISASLSASLQYSHTMDSFRSPIPGYAADVVVAGVQKTF